MIRKIYFVLISLMLLSVQSFSQTKVYAVTSGELLFQWADVEYTQEYMDAHPNDEIVDNPLRFTLFLHLGQYVHMDFSNTFGLYTGLALRNVGLITNERLEIGSEMKDYKIIRRTYSLGLPLALKLGTFKDHFYVFGGGEYELAFAYKEKYWNSHSRSGAKTKYTEWFGGQTPLFIPSAFVGVQMPGGINVKFKYYLNDFLDNTYKYPQSDNNLRVSDLTRYQTSTVMYISVSWQFDTAYIFDKSSRPSNERISGLY